jgi:hypothetical protein
MHREAVAGAIPTVGVSADDTVVRCVPWDALSPAGRFRSKSNDLPDRSVYFVQLDP